MKIVTHKQIVSLGISPATCIEWVKESFSLKKSSQLPAKISVHPQGSDFFTSMPCLVSQADRFGVKVISRIEGSTPLMSSMLMLFNSVSGEILALMDTDWITAMRTGAVAALAAHTFRHSGHCSYSFIGLGNTARATLLCMLESEPEKHFKVLLTRHKGQELSFISRFEGYGNVSFECVDTPEDAIRDSDVIISCISSADSLICSDVNLFREGCLVIPVHSRGFQNCDTEFDKVFGDDTGHVCGFKFFNQFRRYAEFCDVLDGTAVGRENDRERILSYNIGIGLHDVVFASHILPMIEASCSDIALDKPVDKFWI